MCLLSLASCKKQNSIIRIQLQQWHTRLKSFWKVQTLKMNDNYTKYDFDWFGLWKKMSLLFTKDWCHQKPLKGLSPCRMWPLDRLKNVFFKCVMCEQMRSLRFTSKISCWIFPLLMGSTGALWAWNFYEKIYCLLKQVRAGADETMLPPSGAKYMNYQRRLENLLGPQSKSLIVTLRGPLTSGHHHYVINNSTSTIIIFHLNNMKT